MVPKFTSVILTYYYNYIPTLCRDTHRTFLRPVFFWCICLQSNTFFHEFILSLTVHTCPQNLGKECGMKPRTSVPLAGYNYWRPVNLSFLSNTILGPHWAERELSHASSKNICLSKARPVSITALSSTFWTPTRFYQRFTFFNLDIICSEIASFCHAVLPMACSYRNERSAKVVKHPPYCLFTRETRAFTDLTSYVAQLALYEPKSETNTAFRACLPRLAHKAPVMQAKPICRGTVRPWIIQRLLLSMVRLSHGRFRLID